MQMWFSPRRTVPLQRDYQPILVVQETEDATHSSSPRLLRVRGDLHASELYMVPTKL
jgi:hypothetical protein